MRTPTTVVLWLSLLFHSAVFACDDWAAMVVSVNGHVSLKPDQAENQTLKPDDMICPGQQLEVGTNSRAAIYLRNNSFVRLDQNTIISFPSSGAIQSQSFWIEIKQGVSHFISRLTRRFDVKTAYTNTAVDGTEFLVAVDVDGTKVSVIEGQVSVTQLQTGDVRSLTDGQRAIVPTAADMQVKQIKATDTVDWALYFPPLLVFDQLKSAEFDNEISLAYKHVQQGRADLAIQVLASIHAKDSAVKSALASSFLAAGNLTEAKKAVDNVQTAEALAIQSIIATLTNQPQQAVPLALSAREMNSASLAALLALTYAYQGNLQLDVALQLAREGVGQHPDEYAIWVRLSELQVATGDISGAEHSIKRAVALNGTDSSVLIQSGFIDLFNHRYNLAQSQFKSAIHSDSENPQARLGLGLVLLRQGELEAGRMQLEYAVSLDPARSVLRSYLGRAYFEEKRDDEASVQWELAKQFDPQDPTAYYYEGVRKLYSNDPIGAIEELETSRRLNDTRALYRSETLLQSDAASRSATLARAYDEVGYDQGVLLAGWDAIRQDPTNSEGHRLLADKYRGNSRYDAARASELLQSQLWQPLSAYPLQPQLSETGIGFVEGAGPQQPGYNEYHSLFTQDGVYGSVNGFGGSDGTWADDVVGSFLAGPVAVSLGQYHFESDGWRENTEQEQDIYNGFLQWQVSTQTDIQLESRKMNWSHGSLVPEIDNVELGAVEYEEDRETKRLGVKHRFNPSNVILFSYIKQDVDVSRDTLSELELSTGSRTDATDTYELQYVVVNDAFDLVAGAGSADYEIKKYGFLGLEFPGGGLLPNQFDIQIDTAIEEEIDHGNAYFYISAPQSSKYTWLLGLDYDRFDSNVDSAVINTQPAFIPFPPPGQFEPISSTVLDARSESRDQYSPKLGVSYQSDWGSSLRFALFRTASTSSASDQTIKPGQVVGFNQFYDDVDFSDAKNIAFGYDQKTGENMEFGVSVIRRMIDYPEWNTMSNRYIRNEYSELLVETLAIRQFWNVGSALFGVRWYEKRLARANEIALNEPQSSESYSVPFEVTLVNQNNWLFNISQNYYHHRFEYEASNDAKIVEASWVTNVSISKVLPKNFGKFRIGVENLLDSEKEVSNFDQTRLMYYPSRFIYCSVNFTL